MEKLKDYKARQQFQGLFKKIVTDTVQNNNGMQQTKQIQALKQVEDQQARFNRAKDLLLSGELDADDYRSIKRETETKTAALQQILFAMTEPLEVINKRLKKQEKILLNLSFLYQKATVAQKRKLIGFLFPENLTYTKDGLTGKRLGVVLKLIYNT